MGVPIFATTDQGRNIAKALGEAPEFHNIPCFSHMMHNCALGAVGKVEAL
jgi:hypothetical protein